MKKFLIILFVFCTVALGQGAKSKFVVSISGELDVNTSDALADIINHAVIKNQKYSVLPNDRQFRETLQKEWKKGNVSDERIISLAKNAGADYLCFAKITSLFGSNQVAIQLVNLRTDPMEYSDMGIARGKLNDLDIFAQKIEEAVDDMLGIGKKANKEEAETPKKKTSFYDSRNGKQYKIVTIGTQTWMAENLNIDLLGSKCQNDSPANCRKYGRLYDWETAMDACPSGWHLPSKEEWGTLMEAVGGEKTAGKYLKATSGWKSELKSGNGTDAYGFAALPGGSHNSVVFTGDGGAGWWWSSSDGYSQYIRNFAYVRVMSYAYEKASENGHGQENFFSVRCLQD